MGSGAIVRSDNGGASWRVTGYSSKDVVRQGQELVAVGGSSTVVSIDAGLSWHVLQVQVGNLNFAVFTEDKIHNSHAIAVGDNTVALIATQNLPILRKAALKFNPGKVDDTLSLQIEPRKASCGDKGLLITVLAESHHRFIEEQQPLKVVGEKSINQLSEEAVVTYDIPVTLAASLGAEGIGAKPGDRFWYAIKLTCDGWTVQYPSEGKGATSQVYIPWYTRLEWWHWLAVTLTGFALLAVTVFLIRPIWIAIIVFQPVWDHWPKPNCRCWILSWGSCCRFLTFGWCCCWCVSRVCWMPGSINRLKPGKLTLKI